MLLVFTELAAARITSPPALCTSETKFVTLALNVATAVPADVSLYRYVHADFHP